MSDAEQIVADAMSRDASEEPSVPRQRPEPEYEDITIREVSIGFVGHIERMTLYPEDEMTADFQGNIRVIFHSMKQGPLAAPEFVSYTGHTLWHKLIELPHRRIKGTVRPDPKVMMQNFLKQHQRPTASDSSD